MPSPIRTVSYSSSVSFHHRLGGPTLNVNTTSRQELEPRSMTATWRFCSALRAAAVVVRQLTPS